MPCTLSSDALFWTETLNHMLYNIVNLKLNEPVTITAQQTKFGLPDHWDMLIFESASPLIPLHPLQIKLAWYADDYRIEGSSISGPKVHLQKLHRPRSNWQHKFITVSVDGKNTAALEAGIKLVLRPKH